MPFIVKQTLCSKEVCAMIGISLRTLSRLRQRDPSFPKPIAALSLGRNHLYLRSDVDKWLEAAAHSA